MRHIFTSVAIVITTLTLSGVEGQSPATPAETTLAVSGRTNATPWIAGRNRFVAVA